MAFTLAARRSCFASSVVMRSSSLPSAARMAVSPGDIWICSSALGVVFVCLLVPCGTSSASISSCFCGPTFCVGGVGLGTAGGGDLFLGILRGPSLLSLAIVSSCLFDSFWCDLFSIFSSLLISSRISTFCLSITFLNSKIVAFSLCVAWKGVGDLNGGDSGGEGNSGVRALGDPLGQPTFLSAFPRWSPGPPLDLERSRSATFSAPPRRLEPLRAVNAARPAASQRRFPAVAAGLDQERP